ncbi:hypothetical protein QEZ54_04765 [Catellatospora sp. KI3]|uniref:hypothetical protein n=1 Tax=Catellatospora sp. KI3 TaxID=3041620 RepID=UPI002483054B|nr:hypothetical protein [Catellatospora sp. KI3]MDI1460270.1 hypothetical protein [Catellatospora sp. KI3]
MQRGGTHDAESPDRDRGVGRRRAPEAPVSGAGAPDRFNGFVERKPPPPAGGAQDRFGTPDRTSRTFGRDAGSQDRSSTSGRGTQDRTRLSDSGTPDRSAGPGRGTQDRSGTLGRGTQDRSGTLGRGTQDRSGALGRGSQDRGTQDRGAQDRGAQDRGASGRGASFDQSPPPARPGTPSVGPGGFEPGRRGAEPGLGQTPPPGPGRRPGPGGPVPGEPPGARNGALTRPRGVGDPPPPVQAGRGATATPPRRGAEPPAQRPGTLPAPVSPGLPARAGAVPGGRTAAPANPANRVRVTPPPTRPSVAPPPPPPPPQRVGGIRPADTASRFQRLPINPNVSSRWKKTLSVLGVVAVLAACAVGSFLMVLDEKNSSGAQANSSPPPTATPVDISSREVDGQPLSTQEVFPAAKIVIDVNKPTEAYTLIKAQPLKDCRAATNGEITKLIAKLGCSQVVRGTLRSPNGQYLVTGGIVNLDTVASAEQAYEAIKPIVDAGKGRFLGYAPDSKTRPLALSSTHAGWNIKGHYLVYCVIARSDGDEIAVGDPFAKQILYDVIEFYLRGKVLEDRAYDPIAPSGTPDPAAAPSAG